jgi:phosphomannomutase
MRQLKIGTSWVRGVIGDAFTPELAIQFACAFGTYCDGGSVVLGRDTRRSSPMLHAAVQSALISTGCRVIDLGVCTTPLVSHAVRRHGAAGGISITGSHNDAEWNALKFLGPAGSLLNAANSEELLDIYHASAYSFSGWDGLQRTILDDGAVSSYVDDLARDLDAASIIAKGYRVAVDFSNGASHGVCSRFLQRLGCELVPLNERPARRFSHAPAPQVENMRQLEAVLPYVKADVGAAINVDGDRAGFVTHDGRALSEEVALPLVVDHVLARRPGLVVTNLSTSQMVDAVAARHGSTVLRAEVGEGYVMDRAALEGAVVCGEGCGGVALTPQSATFDALQTLGQVLEAMALSGATLADLTAGLPVFAMRKGELACSPDRVYRVIEAVREEFDDAVVNEADGVRLAWPDQWLHVRASNTEPIVRIIAEAPDQTALDALFSRADTAARRGASGFGRSDHNPAGSATRSGKP